MRSNTDDPITVQSWSRLYGAKHRWERLIEFPAGITPPKKVRIYRRMGQYILSWWDPRAGKSLSERVDGDLLAALVKAREIDTRIADRKSAGLGTRRRIGHPELVDQFLEDLRRRASAGEVTPRTAERYRTALDHYLTFTAVPGIAKDFPTAASSDREFRLAFTAFLQERAICGNGRQGGQTKRMRGQRIVTDTVRALYEWAIDGERGGLLPENFKNPFLRSGSNRALLSGDPLAEPDITMAMAANFLTTCDDFEFGIFVPIIYFGLRAAEPCFLFREHLLPDWLLVPNVPELDYTTKGRRDKRFPLPTGLDDYWLRIRQKRTGGPLYLHRAVAEGSETPPHFGKSLEELQAIYRERKAQETPGAVDGIRLRNRLMADAGAIDYDELARGFRRVAKGFGCPVAATIKDFRHLFATTLANAGFPEGYRKYLLGHAPGRDAAVAYTHLNRLQEHCAKVYEGECGPVIEVLRERLKTEV